MMININRFLKNSILLLLSFNCIVVAAQQTTTYDNFDASSLTATNKKFGWNFNPIEYDPEILYSCVNAVANYARQIYKNADSLTPNESLTNAAEIQASFMAKEEERTHENVVSALKTPQLRGVSVGATKRVNELITRVKATKGIEDYSYLDVATETILSLLKNKKTESTILDKQYTFVGIGCAVDAFNRYCYFSIVLGNDLSFNQGVVAYKNTTYTRKAYGLKPYDEKICRKCQTRNIELLQKYIEVKGNDIYFNHPNVKELKRIIGKDKDGLAIDIVQHKQYPCNSSSNDVDYNYPNRGIMFKYMTFPKMLKKNENKDSKDKSLRVFLGTIPNTVDGQYDINLILIKESSICKTIVKTDIKGVSVDYNAKTSLIADDNGVTTTINYIPKPEKTVLEFNIPFEQSKSTYEQKDIKPFIDALNESKFIIDSINIIAFTSFEGDETLNFNLQKKRSESIVKVIEQMQNKDIPYAIEQNDGWDLFVKDIPSEYKYLTEESKTNAKNALRNSKIKSELEPILEKHRFANVKLFATYDISTNKNEQDFITNKFNRCLKNGDLAMAFAIQKFMIKRVEEGKYSRYQVQNLEIPENAKMLPFLTNKYYMLSFFGLSDEDKQKIANLEKLDNKNVICEFNALCCNINNLEISDAGQIATRQSKIDKFYNNAVGRANINKVDALNIAFQYKILDFINSNENPDEALMETTYEKIKSIALSNINDWKKAYEVASSFIEYGDYEFARSVMDPYISDDNVSEDFIFTYLNLYSIDETTYTSKKFDLACKLAVQKNRTRFCSEIKTYSYLIRENVEAKNIICNECK